MEVWKTSNTQKRYEDKKITVRIPAGERQYFTDKAKTLGKSVDQLKIEGVRSYKE